MITQKINVGKNTIQLSIEQHDQNAFKCFYSLNAFIDEPLVGTHGELIVFNTIEEILEYATTYFNKKTIDKAPGSYTEQELQEIINKPMKIKYKEENGINEVIGMIKNYTPATDSSKPSITYSPGFVKIKIGKQQYITLFLILYTLIICETYTKRIVL